MFIYAFECLTCLIEDLKNINVDLKLQKIGLLNLALTYQNHLMSNHSELANILRRNTGPDFPLSFFRQPCRSIVVWYLPVRMDYWHLLKQKKKITLKSGTFRPFMATFEIEIVTSGSVVLVFSILEHCRFCASWYAMGCKRSTFLCHLKLRNSNLKIRHADIS